MLGTSLTDLAFSLHVCESQLCEQWAVCWEDSRVQASGRWVNVSPLRAPRRLLTSAHSISGGNCSGVPTGGPQRCAGRGRGGHGRSCCHGNRHRKNVLSENHCAFRQALPGCHSSQRHPEHHLSGESHQPQSSVELRSELWAPSLRSGVPWSLGAAWALGTEDPPCLSPPAHLWGGDSESSGGSTCTGSLCPLGHLCCEATPIMGTWLMTFQMS